MKRIAAAVCLLVLLCGCSGKNEDLDRAMSVRARLLNRGFEFETDITADYGDKTYTFSARCTADTGGNVTFTVTKPETVAGITGSISANGGKLTFDGKALAFPLLADNQLTPVSAPYVLVKTLRSGYLTSCGKEGELLRLAIDDSYADDALHLDIWLDGQDAPVRGEILWQGRRILSMDVRNFSFL